MSESMKKRFMPEIFELDKVGFNLAREIEKATGYTIFYYSDGLLKYLSSPPMLMTIIIK